MKPLKLEEQLNYFTGTERYYQMYPRLNLTDGVKFLCDKAKCFWLMDLIWSYQALPQVRDVAFQFYTVQVNPENQSAVVTCMADNEQILKKQFIEWTDFPLSSIRLYYTDEIVLLPSEY